jgi:hypothetical protein
MCVSILDVSARAESIADTRAESIA